MFEEHYLRLLEMSIYQSQSKDGLSTDGPPCGLWCNSFDSLPARNCLPAASGASAKVTRRFRVALNTASLVCVERTLAATTPTKPRPPHVSVASLFSLQKLRRKPGRMTGNLWPGSLLLAPSLSWKLSLPLISAELLSIVQISRSCL